MSNYTLNRTYSETLRQLQTTDPASADTFNPLFNQLMNNDSNLHDLITATLISQMIPSQTSIPLKGLTIGNFYMPFTYVTLDTITLG